MLKKPGHLFCAARLRLHFAGWLPTGRPTSFSGLCISYSLAVESRGLTTFRCGCLEEDISSGDVFFIKRSRSQILFVSWKQPLVPRAYNLHSLRSECWYSNPISLPSCIYQNICMQRSEPSSTLCLSDGAVCRGKAGYTREISLYVTMFERKSRVSSTLPPRGQTDCIARNS